MRFLKIKRVFFLMLLTLAFSKVNAQVKTIYFTENKKDFPNPERGFYLASSAKAGDLNKDELIKLRTVNSIKSPTANYATFITLVYKGYLLTDFRDKPISTEFLERIQADFNSVRKAGLKIILRFSYIDKSHKGDCPDGNICPPYGDAPKQIVLNHIEQLKPILAKNGDVIAVVQQGFIGIWGENHYTDYFGDASGNAQGFVPDSSWLDRNQMLKALLDAVPKNRMVQVRTPQFKQRFTDGPHANVTLKSTTEKAAFNQSDKARIAFHNDCFLASKDDYGTFTDNGNSIAKKMEANTILRTYFEQDSKYVAVGGETCDDTFSPQNDCAPFGHAQKEMAAMHYSFLNVSYNNLVNNDWQAQGCMEEIKQRLGYRFVLLKAQLAQNQKLNHPFNINILLNNTGFASPYNPRKANIILRNTLTKQIYSIPLKSNVQKWFSGKHLINENIVLPKKLKTGSYEVLIHFPDDAKSLKNRPEYCIRLANNDIWEANTGYNKLNHTVKITN